MLRPRSPLGDPLPQNLDFLIGKLVAAHIGGRHAADRVLRAHALEQSTRRQVAAHDGVAAVGQLCERALFGVETKVRLAGAIIGPVASKAALGKNRPDLAIKVDRGWHGVGSPGGRPGYRQKDREREQPKTATPAGHGIVNNRMPLSLPEGQRTSNIETATCGRGYLSG